MNTFGVRVYKQDFAFACAHFLLFPDGTREVLHGHNYRVRVEVTGALAGDLVVDFLDLKPIVRRLCKALHHRTLLPANNPALTVSEADGQVTAVHEPTGARFVFPAADVRRLPIPNTSCERLAEYVLEAIAVELRASFGTDRTFEAIEVSVEEALGQAAFCRRRITER